MFDVDYRVCIDVHILLLIDICEAMEAVSFTHLPTQ